MATAAVRVTRKDGLERKTHTLLLVAIAGVIALAHVATNGRYGFHRDELQFLSDARHMEWGFVAYPPLTPFVERISMAVFGLNMVGLRLASVLAQAMAIVVTGLMARELGGGRLAQAVAAVSIALSPLPMFEATEFQYTTFDYLWWVLIAYCVIRLLKSENPRWWLAIGVFAGLGLMTKYSIVFYIAGILGGFLLTRARRFLLNWYFAGALVLTVLICLPNLLWQAHHQFISYEFLQHIHRRDVGEGRAKGFWWKQLWLCANLFAAPVWIAGLVAFVLSARYRVLAWMYLIPVGLLALGQGRGYYTAGVYPMLLAMGAVAGERWIVPMKAWLRRTLTMVYFAGVCGVGAAMAAVIVPIAPSGPLMRFALENNGDLREEFGWQEMVQTVARIRDSLPPNQRAHLAITTGNYGEYGAIDILGRAYGLPEPIGTTNSEWYRGYPKNAPTTIIALGIRPEEANAIFTNCRIAGHNGNSLGLDNEESRDHPWIFVCGPPRLPAAELWKKHRDFG
ncbi:MAG TPA: glycosyltransferase family 39 protein [Acidobacteriaceae bacterium]|nr:glycosyltransferase family 39 protein [Acidobacteriaceae bacterium]